MLESRALVLRDSLVVAPVIVRRIAWLSYQWPCVVEVGLDLNNGVGNPIPRSCTSLIAIGTLGFAFL